MPGATTHLVVGTAGAGNSQNIHKEKPAVYEFVNDDTHGYYTLHFTEDTLTGRYRTTTGQVLDTLSLKK